MHDTRKKRRNSKKSIKIKTIKVRTSGFFNNKNGLKNRMLSGKMAEKHQNWKIKADIPEK